MYVPSTSRFNFTRFLLNFNKSESAGDILILCINEACDRDHHSDNLEFSRKSQLVREMLFITTNSAPKLDIRNTTIPKLKLFTYFTLM